MPNSHTVNAGERCKPSLWLCSDIDRKQETQEDAMSYTPEHLELWTRPDSYFGADWTGHYPIISAHRDSDCLERSNYRVALAILRAIETEECPAYDYPLQIAHERHFAVGWVDTILIDKDCLSLVKAADELLARLETYPVLDEEDWSNLEFETAATCWENCSVSERLYWCDRYEVSIFAARHSHMPEDQTGELLSALAE